MIAFEFGKGNHLERSCCNPFTLQVMVVVSVVMVVLVLQMLSVRQSFTSPPHHRLRSRYHPSRHHRMRSHVILDHFCGRSASGQWRAGRAGLWACHSHLQHMLSIYLKKVYIDKYTNLIDPTYFVIKMCVSRHHSKM